MGEGSVYYLKVLYVMYCIANKQLSSTHVSHNIYVYCLGMAFRGIYRCALTDVTGGSRLCLL